MEVGSSAHHRSAQDRLVADVYLELRRIASKQRRNEQFNATMQTTALVHEAWLRIAESDSALQPKTEAHLKALTSRVIRNVLVDYARQATARKRKPDQQDISEMQLLLVDAGLDVGLLDLEKAMHMLGAHSPRLMQLVEYRFFGGMSIPEIAEVFELSSRTVERDWQKAKVYLLRNLYKT